MEKFLARRLLCIKFLARNGPARTTPLLFTAAEPFHCRVCLLNAGGVLRYSTTENDGTKVNSSQSVDDNAACIEEGAEQGRKKQSEDKIRSRILYHALDHVNEHGWSRKALSRGAEDIGYAAVAEGMFENEGADLVLYFVKESNEKLFRYMQEHIDEFKDSNGKLDVSGFIQDVIQYRLSLTIPYISSWPEAMKLLLSPKILSESMNELGHMVDEIWYQAGDRSSDFNWYTKRAMLAKLYTSTQLYMINDQSSDFNDTWHFLDRRFVLFYF